MKFHSRAKRSALDMENPVGYLFRVAHNCCIDQTRNRPNVTVSDEGLVLPSDRHHHADLFESADFVNSTLSTLDFTHREAFVLHELEEMTYEEMAAATGETISALKNRVWRARKQLRTLLAPLFSRNESQVLAKTKDNYFDDDPFTDIHT